MTMSAIDSLRRRAPARVLSAAILLCGLGGCADRATLFANPDPALNKPAEAFASDAASRFPYKDSAPHASEPKVRAQVGYTINRLEVVNFTGQDWSNVEVWVNHRYVCYLPHMEDRILKRIPFALLYDSTGDRFPIDNSIVRVENVEVYRQGTMYEVVCHNADY
jgi:hypothetical protein